VASRLGLHVLPLVWLLLGVGAPLLRVLLQGLQLAGAELVLGRVLLLGLQVAGAELVLGRALLV
jgi:hypothetical protein